MTQYKIVPVRSTKEMDDAHALALCNVEAEWECMLAAAPTGHGLVIVSREDLEAVVRKFNIVVADHDETILFSTRQAAARLRQALETK